jgi:hypothetical protein
MTILEGFSKWFVNAAGELVIKALSSPNFVSGVSGWTIRKDGSVEFNFGIFRGSIINGGLFVYSGAPALGSLIIAISPSVGTDAFGNHYGAGLTFPPDDGSFKLAEISRVVFGANQVLHIRGPGNAVGDIIAIDLYDNGSLSIISQGNISIDSGSVFIGPSGGASPGDLIRLRTATDFQPMAGPKGQYYAEEVNPPAQVIATGTVTTLINLTALNLDSDYGSAFNLATGTWTCPVDSWYDIDACTQYSTWVAGSRTDLSLRVNGVIDMEQDQPSTSGSVTTGGGRKFLAGDTVTFVVIQTTGANRTIAPARSTISIRRRL